MPEMNGRELANAILMDLPALRVLFMSGYAGDVLAQHGVVEDGVRLIRKPFKRCEVASKVREVLDEG